MIRTDKTPFIKSKSSKQLLASTFAVVLITLAMAFTSIAIAFDLAILPVKFIAWIILLQLIYAILIQIYKKIYVRTNSKWL